MQEEAPRLRAKGQRCTVVIASDGEASDGSVEQALRPLLHLPVWVVIRLCTDEDKIVEYWNGIDAELELEMDVLDDLCGEAGEVAEHNPWLTYGTPLHRVREWGTSRKVVDMLDEKRLTGTSSYVGCGMCAVAGLHRHVPYSTLHITPICAMSLQPPSSWTLPRWCLEGMRSTGCPIPVSIGRASRTQCSSAWPRCRSYGTPSGAGGSRGFPSLS